MIYMVISWPFLVRFCGSPNDLIKWFFNSPTIALEIIKLIQFYKTMKLNVV